MLIGVVDNILIKIKRLDCRGLVPVNACDTVVRDGKEIIALSLLLKWTLKKIDTQCMISEGLFLMARKDLKMVKKKK